MMPGSELTLTPVRYTCGNRFMPTRGDSSKMIKYRLNMNTCRISMLDHDIPIDLIKNADPPKEEDPPGRLHSFLQPFRLYRSRTIFLILEKPGAVIR